MLNFGSKYVGWGIVGLAAFAGTATTAAAYAAPTLQSDDRHLEGSSYQLCTDKLSCKLGTPVPHTPVVLLACGSFNPPTVMHLRMFDLAEEELRRRGYDVLGGYMSPVSSDYGKAGLAPTPQRVNMCRLAASTNPLVMVDDWEARQHGYTRTLLVLQHMQGQLQQALGVAAGEDGSCSSSSSSSSSSSASKHSGSALAGQQVQGPPAAAAPAQSGGGNLPPAAAVQQPRPAMVEAGDGPAAGSSSQVRVMLLCGADVLASMAVPGTWCHLPEIFAQHGVVCVARAGTDLAPLFREGSALQPYQANVVLVEEAVGNAISSSAVRQQLAEGRPVRYLLPEPVLQYITQHGLYCRGGGKAGHDSSSN